MPKPKDKFIVVFYSMRPKKGVNTAEKGWMNDQSKVQWDEKFTLSEGLKNKDLDNAQVIINLTQQKVLKYWRAENGTDYASLMEYYLKNYGQYIINFLTPENS